jgi:hypothetical protein
MAAGEHCALQLQRRRHGRRQTRLLTQGDDTSGSWASRNEALDGCTTAPFSYQPDQLMIWAGPWLVFRSDSIAVDFRWLSAREIAPLP